MSSETEAEHAIYQNSQSYMGSSDGFDPTRAIMALIDTNDTLNPEEKEEIKEWVKERRELRIIVTGKTGAGKSSLLNSFIGHPFFKEGDDLDPCTVEVTQHEFEKDGLKVIAWDCPGLQDGSDDEERYLQSLVEKTKGDVDLMVYCINMSQPRAAELRIHGSAITKLTRLLRTEIWSNAVIALTFANSCVSQMIDKNPEIEEQELKKQFKERIELWGSKIKAVLHDLAVPDDIVEALPVFPAGYYTKPHLPGYPYWSSNMWMTTLYAVKERAQPVPIVMNASRFRARTSSLDEESRRSPPERQPIVITSPSRDSESNEHDQTAVSGGAGIGAGVGASVGVLAGSAAGISVAVTGSTAGAVFGGVTLGAVTFGVGAAVGVVLGGAVGLGIGVATGLLIDAHRKHKQKKQQ